ncbi:SDR family NAD(P)-dependent oxidoreductase [Nioella aestuarii]|uniref:SDR family NAD(P)-dependent oxidoreductase n=1 Tax=Nioella aestuarii TaxID=1662864 RepID=UPI003D7F94E5
MKLAIVTGASSGVGAATASVLVKRGYRVVMVARSADKLTELADSLGVLAIAAPANAAHEAEMEPLAARILAEYGAPDLIVNSAGAGQWKRMEDTTEAETRNMMDAPFMASFVTTRVFLPAMLDRGSGVILHVNSPACMATWPSSVGYSAARWALRGLHEALAQDLFGSGVRSCHVIFGKIGSDYFENNPGVLEKMPGMAKTVPDLTPEYCAEKLAFLAESPKHQAVYPFALSANLLLARHFPGLARWLLRL